MTVRTTNVKALDTSSSISKKSYYQMCECYIIVHADIHFIVYNSRVIAPTAYHFINIIKKRVIVLVGVVNL